MPRHDGSGGNYCKPGRKGGNSRKAQGKGSAGKAHRSK